MTKRLYTYLASALLSLSLFSCAKYTTEPGMLGYLFLDLSFHTVSINVTGLTGSGLVLQNNAGDDLSVSANGIATFSTPLFGTVPYNVTVLTQPSTPTQTCTITNGSGTTVSGSDVNVTLTCVNIYTLGGNISGFAAGTNLVILDTISGQTISVVNGSASYLFSTSVPTGTSYNVIVQTQPNTPDYVCSLANASGTIAGANITNIDVTCIAGQLSGGTVFITPTWAVPAQLTTLAGNGPAGAGNVNATGVAARFDNPRGIATDGTNLYVIDKNNSSIRKIVIATGVVTTLTTSPTSPFSTPEGITSDGSNLYITDTGDDTIKQVALATGVTTTLAGGNTGGGVNCGGNIPTICLEGTGTAAAFDNPRGITTDGTNLFVSDSNNHRIRKIVISSGLVSTLAGNGIANAAQLDSPNGIVTNGTNLYVADRGNDVVRIIPIASGTITTLFSLVNIRGITTDGTYLYALTSSNTLHSYNSMTLSAQTLTTIAGQAGAGFTDGNATTTGQLDGPRAITCDGNALYLSDSTNHAIRKYK